ncbi:MAG: hypothetical protein JWP97_135 [Labilithrix sp.]|nr:hypothetical protein [Labilithrix sp.]
MRIALFLVLSLAACSSERPHAAAPSRAPADAGVAAAVAPEPDASGDSPAQARPRKPFPIHSSCPDVVTLAFGDDPKAPGAGRRTLAGNSEIQGPRDVEGKAVVNLLDDKGEPIAKVHVTRGMKGVEVGRSCRTLDAR